MAGKFPPSNSERTVKNFRSVIRQASELKVEVEVLHRTADVAGRRCVVARAGSTSCSRHFQIQFSPAFRTHTKSSHNDAKAILSLLMVNVISDAPLTVQ